MPQKKTDFNKKNFAKNLKHLMERNQISNVKLARYLGLSRAAITNYRKGGSGSTTETLHKIADLFGESIETLYMENPFPKKTIPRKTQISYTMKEPYGEDISFYEVPVFARSLSYTDIIYVKDNFADCILYSFPLCGDKDCYAVKLIDDSLLKSGFPKGSVVIFAANEEVLNGNFAAVLMIKEKKIAIKKVTYQKNKVILSTDTEENTYNKTSDDIKILGKMLDLPFPKIKDKRL